MLYFELYSSKYDSNAVEGKGVGDGEGGSGVAVGSGVGRGVVVGIGVTEGAVVGIKVGDGDDAFFVNGNIVSFSKTLAMITKHVPAMTIAYRLFIFEIILLVQNFETHLSLSVGYFA